MELKDIYLGALVVYRKVKCMIVAHDPITKKNPVLTPVRPDKGIGSGKGNCRTVKDVSKISSFQRWKST